MKNTKVSPTQTTRYELALLILTLTLPLNIIPVFISDGVLVVVNDDEEVEVFGV